MKNLLSSVNYWAVLVATLAYFALGAIWYSFLFHKPWMELMHLPENMKMSVSPFIYLHPFLVQILITLSLALILAALDVKNWRTGAWVSFLVALGLTFSPYAVTEHYALTPFALTLINGGYHVAGLALAGAILGAWRK